MEVFKRIIYASFGVFLGLLITSFIFGGLTSFPISNLITLLIIFSFIVVVTNMFLKKSVIWSIHLLSITLSFTTLFLILVKGLVYIIGINSHFFGLITVLGLAISISLYVLAFKKLDKHYD